MKEIKWGVLAPGNIAVKFATGLIGAEGNRLHAAGSRSSERAQDFVKQFGGSKWYGSYKELAEDPEVDAVYVASPHPFHAEQAIMCLEMGKPVLCEKPFAVNAAQAEEMISCARRNKVFLMEAMWTRFLPHMQQVKKWVTTGAIGDVQQVTADFSFRTEVNPKGRLFDVNLAGGGLLDVGIYPVSLANFIFGSQPVNVKGVAHIGSTGVDEQAALSLMYPGGGVANLSCGIRVNGRHNAAIIGTKGRIDIPPAFWNGTRAELTTESGTTVFEQQHLSNGYEYEAMEAAACIRRGDTESAIMPLDESLKTMQVLDELRSQWGLVFPFEK